MWKMDIDMLIANHEMNDSEQNLDRRLRQRERKSYTEDCMNDEEIEGRRMFSVEEKLTSDRFNAKFVQEMKGDDVCLKYLQENGFQYPIVVREKAGLGMRLPSKNFTVQDVRQCVGSRRMLDVMDVTTQKDIEMSMKDWVKYFENHQRDRLLNVISLEFSHTKLENYIESPKLVREIDWVDNVWPRHLKKSQIESTNIIEDMKYPKVQKYCLMSVKGCYTDFHIDFGGTSVWYHILHGRKVFWLIPPTELNVQLYEQWVLSGKQGDVFFGDTVDECGRIELQEGWTFFIPTGWIHAVFTPKDSLVFGGNFLHGFGIEKQLRIAQVEDITRVPSKFRYPFYTEMLWYVLARYVECLLDRCHIVSEEGSDGDHPADKKRIKNNGCKSESSGESEGESPNKDNLLDSEYISSTPTSEHSTQENAAGETVVINDGESKGKSEDHIHLTPFEISGIKAIVRWLAQLPISKRNVPDMIKDPGALLRDVKLVLELHHDDDPNLAATGKPILTWPDMPKKTKPVKPKLMISHKLPLKTNGSNSKLSSNARRRRTRCKKCEACLRADCGDCHFCKDMKKFGGAGRMKQSCISRQCMAPILPHTACCMLCGKDGWEKSENPNEEEMSTLMECSICWEIVHPECLLGKTGTVLDESSICDDLPNSWECPKCFEEQKNKSGTAPKVSSLLRLIRPVKFKNSESLLSSIANRENSLSPETVADGNSPFDLPHSERFKRLVDYDNDSQNWKKPCLETKPEAFETVQNLANEISNPINIIKVKSDGECHVRSCVRQTPILTNESLPVKCKGLDRELADKGKSVLKGPTTSLLKHKVASGIDQTVVGSVLHCPLKSSGQSTLLASKQLQMSSGASSLLPNDGKKSVSRTQRSNSSHSGTPESKEKVLKKPLYVVRPAPIFDIKDKSQSPTNGQNLALDKECMLSVFKYLSPTDLCCCMMVCKTWNAWCLDRRLWARIDLAQKKVSSQLLAGVIRRQPSYLGLGWTNISKKHLAWLITRLPQLRHLDLSGCSWVAVMALVTCNCPILQGLDLKWVEGMNDVHMRELLAPPPDSRPGLLESKSRLRNLSELRLSGCDITDVSLRYITQHLRNLNKLDLSHCVKITDAGIALVTAVGSSTRDSITHIDLSGCKRLTDNCLEHLKRCTNLVFVDLRNCPEISVISCRKLIAQSLHPLMMAEAKLIEKQCNYSSIGADQTI
ncbi:hypothetical protein CHUAL_007917 [Chamberlinius hualienensis]